MILDPDHMGQKGAAVPRESPSLVISNTRQKTSITGTTTKNWYRTKVIEPPKPECSRSGQTRVLSSTGLFGERHKTQTKKRRNENKCVIRRRQGACAYVRAIVVTEIAAAAVLRSFAALDAVRPRCREQNRTRTSCQRVLSV